MIPCILTVGEELATQLKGMLEKFRLPEQYDEDRRLLT